jgi:hypothetical protein
MYINIKWYMSNFSKNEEGIKENGGGDEFKYDIYDIL